jgi:hypothetical protein
VEEIINKLIEIDNESRNKIEVAERTKENIDEMIDEKLQKEKQKIDSLYSAKIRLKQDEYKTKLENEEVRVENETNNKILNINEKYLKNKENISEMIFKKIINI